MSDELLDDEVASEDELKAAIKKLRDQQDKPLLHDPFWRSCFLFGVPANELLEDDVSGPGGFITAPALLTDSSPDSGLRETAVEAMRKDWITVGNDLRIAMLRHRLEIVSQAAK